MTILTKRERIAKLSLYELGYKYLLDNFHKFTETNKIRVALEVMKILERDDSKTKNEERPIVVMNDIKLTDGQPLRYDFGN